MTHCIVHASPSLWCAVCPGVTLTPLFMLRQWPASEMTPRHLDGAHSWQGGKADGKEKRYRTAMTLLNVLMGMRTKRHGGSVSLSFSDSSASCPLQLLRYLTNMGWMQMVRKCDQIWSKCSSEKEGESGLIHTLVGLDVVDVRTTSKLHSEERSVNKPPPR